MTDGPTVIETPWRREPALLAERLAAWADQTIAPGSRLGTVSAPDGNGMSSETVLFEVVEPSGREHRLVARLAPDPTVFPVFEHYDLELQGRCMRLVAEHTSVPVPAVPFYEPDPQWLGTPFLVMERIAGTAPIDVPPYVFTGWVSDLTPEERRDLMERSVGVLAELHTITPAAHDLDFLAPDASSGDVLDDLLAAQRRYYEWGREGLHSSLVEATFTWLEANRPAAGEVVLNWGDSRIGNMMYVGTAPVAVLDWEMAALGPREVDLAWMIFLHRFFQSLAERYGFPGLPDFMRRDDAVAIYERRTGHTVTALDWFEVYAALRFAIVSVRTSLRGVHYGQQDPVDDPDELIMFKPLLEQMLAGTYWD